MAATADGGAELDLKVFQTYLTDVVPNAIGGSVGELVDALEHVPEAVAGCVPFFLQPLVSTFSRVEKANTYYI